MPRGDEPLSIPPPETGPGKLCCHNAFGIAMGKKVTKLNITITASSASRNGPGCLGRWRLFGLVPKLRMVRRKRLLRACDVRSGQRATFDTVCCPVYRTVYRNRGGKKTTGGWCRRSVFEGDGTCRTQFDHRPSGVSGPM